VSSPQHAKTKPSIKHLVEDEAPEGTAPSCRELASLVAAGKDQARTRERPFLSSPSPARCGGGRRIGTPSLPLRPAELARNSFLGSHGQTSYQPADGLVSVMLRDVR
jgi:hypothetical protein